MFSGVPRCESLNGILPATSSTKMFSNERLKAHKLIFQRVINQSIDQPIIIIIFIQE